MTLVRVDFKASDFTDLIQQKGYNLLWEQRVRCPCVDPATGHGVSGCPQCDGRGNFYFGEVTPMKGIITRQNKELQIGDAIGALDPGEGYLTTSSAYKLAYQDRITNLDSVMNYNETLIHDETGGDQLRYPPVDAIQFACWQPTKHSNIIQLKENADFIVASDGTIKWTSSNKPTNNSGISIRYNCHPVWLVWDIPNVVRDTFVKFDNLVDTWTAMPLRVRVRLEFMGATK